MAEQTAAPAPPRAQSSNQGAVARFLAATELDTRLLGMIGALVIIWVGFHLLSGGIFLTPRNLWNLSVQTSEVGVMATGMVLVIVTRNIDLSVGAIVAFVGVTMGVVQAQILPQYLGLGNPSIWIIAVAVGLLAGVIIGAIQGTIIAYFEVPAFIVTLGGYLIWRGAAYEVAHGQTIAPLDETFQLLGGGPAGSIGALWSWVLAAIAIIAIVVGLILGRRQRRRFHFPLRPLWAEATLAIAGCVLVIAFVSVANAYGWPKGIANAYAASHNITVPEGGLFISTGIAVPVLIFIGAGIVMTFITMRTRFGRYVFAMGGNPEAAELAGINTRWVTVKIFMLMGALCGVSAVIASARLNSAANSLGTLDELYVIASAVVGGTSLSGGLGTVVGAMMGAVVMQSLQSGMQLMGLDTPKQSIVVGIVLVFAVWLDTLYRRRAK
jgi:D-xylose transport system permease protein